VRTASLVIARSSAWIFAESWLSSRATSEIAKRCEAHLRDVGGVVVDQRDAVLVIGGGEVQQVHLHELEVEGVVDDVGDPALEAGVVGEGQHAVLVEDRERPALVGDVVRDRDLRALGDLLHARVRLGVVADLRVVDRGELHELGAVLLVEGRHVRLVLGEVRVDLAVGQQPVVLHVVADLHELDRVPLLGRDLRGGGDHVGHRREVRGDLDQGVLAAPVGGAVGP
jgi:hypothetical protein